MSDIELDKKFFDLADAFIHLANDQANDVGNEKASSALTYAAARFSAFLVAAESKSLDELKALRQEAKDHFMPIYEQDLERNLNDYENNYDAYIKNTEIHNKQLKIDA